MEVKEVASRASRFFGGGDDILSIGRREMVALCGYFQGVVEGRITVGQSMVQRIILRENVPLERKNSYVGPLEEHHKQLILDIFSSGMTCEGQPLKGLAAERDSWVEKG